MWCKTIKMKVEIKNVLGPRGIRNTEYGMQIVLPGKISQHHVLDALLPQSPRGCVQTSLHNS